MVKEVLKVDNNSNGAFTEINGGADSIADPPINACVSETKITKRAACAQPKHNNSL